MTSNNAGFAVDIPTVETEEENLACWEKNNQIDAYIRKIEFEEAEFSQDGYDIRLRGNIVLKPKPNIIFAALLWPILVTESYARRYFFSAYAPQLIGGITALVLQIAAAVYVYDLVLSSKPDSCTALEGSTLLRIVCVTVLSAFVMNEVLHSYGFLRWVSRLPKWKNEDREKLDSLYTGFALQKKIFTNKHGIEYKVNHISAGGISDCYRILMISAGVLKGVIEMSILAGGSGFILYANKNEEILLNAVSLIFILEIDDYMYRYLLSDVLKRFIKNSTPEIAIIKRLKVDENQPGSEQHTIMEREILSKWGPWMNLMLLPLLMVIFYFSWCGLEF